MHRNVTANSIRSGVSYGAVATLLSRKRCIAITGHDDDELLNQFHIYDLYDRHNWEFGAGTRRRLGGEKVCPDTKAL